MQGRMNILWFRVARGYTASGPDPHKRAGL
jgi:hypothetical protein